MTHVMDIGTDLDDLLGRLAGDLTDNRARGRPSTSMRRRPTTAARSCGPLAGLTSPVWYS